MTETDVVATKAPESDAQEDIPTGNVPVNDNHEAETNADEAPAPAQPKLGEHCVTDRPTRSSPRASRWCTADFDAHMQQAVKARQASSGNLTISM